MRRVLLLAILPVIFGNTVWASTLVYKPILPSFGGNPLNWSGFLSEASAQNIYHPPSKPSKTTTPVEEFQRRLQYLILSRLASKIVNAAFGEEEELPEGSYEIGNFQVQVTPSDGTIQVHMVDTTSGQETTVEVPMYK